MDGSSLEVLPEHIQDKIWKMKRELEKKEKQIQNDKLHQPQPHLYLYFDPDNPNEALILYQKKNNWSQIVWDLKFDTFSKGQWLTHAVIKPEYSSYYGGLFIYDYIEARNNNSYCRYNVLCKPPYFTALLLMKQENYYRELHFRKAANRPGVVFTGINFPIKVSINSNLFDMLGFVKDITENFERPENLMISDVRKWPTNIIFDNKDISIIDNTLMVDGKDIWNSDSLDFSMIKPPIDYPICVEWNNKMITWNQRNSYKDFMKDHIKYKTGKFIEWSVLKQCFQKWHNNNHMRHDIKINLVKQYFIDNLGQLKVSNGKQGFKNMELHF